jgi:hypothetical protein
LYLRRRVKGKRDHGFIQNTFGVREMRAMLSFISIRLT